MNRSSPRRKSWGRPMPVDLFEWTINLQKSIPLLDRIRVRGIKVEICIDYSSDQLIASLRNATNSYQGCLISRYELEDQRFHLIMERLNHGIKMLDRGPDPAESEPERDEYEEIIAAQEIMEHQ